MKTVNFRCSECDCDTTLDLTTEEAEETGNEIECPLCGGKAKKFNFKNNSQRVKIFD